MKKLTLLTHAGPIFLIAACPAQQNGPARAERPAGRAYAPGKEIYFVHTEAPDPQVVINMPFVVWDGGQR